MMFFAILVALFFARQAGTHMDPRTHEQIGDWHPVLLPPILYLNTAILLLSSLTMEIARQNIFREIDVLEEWLGLGHPALQPDAAVGSRDAWVRALYSLLDNGRRGSSLPPRASH